MISESSSLLLVHVNRDPEKWNILQVECDFPRNYIFPTSNKCMAPKFIRMTIQLVNITDYQIFSIVTKKLLKVLPKSQASTKLGSTIQKQAVPDLTIHFSDLTEQKVTRAVYGIYPIWTRTKKNNPLPPVFPEHQHHSKQ